jgi:hypothetical protein
MKRNEFEISDIDYILSTVGNAYFSGLSFKEFWQCVSVCIENNPKLDREQLDHAVDIAIKLKELLNAK